MKKVILLILGYSVAQTVLAQDLGSGEIHGNFQTDIQYYNEDTTIGAATVPEKMLMNGFANFIYTNGRFSAGVRFESYLNALQGFDSRYKGTGFPYRYATYTADEFEITAGSYYEQFGSGLILRTYEEKNLGYDNSLDGIRIKYNPIKGVYFKGVYGRQRFFFDYGPGIVRGIDGEIFVNELRESWMEKKTKLILGASAVSKYQADRNPIYNLPENVAAFAGRINVSRGKVNVMGEYAYKINDPSADNGNIYKPGEALYLSASYSQKGLGVIVSAKRIDNMSFRSDRAENLNNLLINYIPALTKQHTYNLVATIYPYASRPTGEMGLQADVTYKFKKGTFLGGEYGTDLALNFSGVNSIEMLVVNDSTRVGYTSDFFKVGPDVYYRDFNIEIGKKLNKKVKFIAQYVNLAYNKDVIQGKTGYGIVYSDIGILDLTYSFLPKHSVRIELQGLFTKHHDGGWAMGLIEYSLGSNWFFAVMDQYNYGNYVEADRLHYYSAAFGFTKNTNRIALSYGRQREGIYCVGGVCRNVPASNGLTLSITSSF